MNLNQFPLWTAVVTPFHPDLKIDFVSFEKLLLEQEEAKNGVVILGSTGENLSFSDEEKIEIVNFVCDLELSIPIMVGIPGFYAPGAVKWLKHLNQMPVHAYLMVTPIYAKPNDLGQYEWFKELLDTATRPSMLYNVPSRSGIKLSVEAMKKLLGHKNFWAIKEASGSVDEFSNYKKNLPGISMYCGDDGLMPEFAKAGAVGLVSVASNAWAKETHLYTELCLKGTLKEDKMWKEAADSLFLCSNPVPVKGLMHTRGMIETPKSRPPLNSQDLKELPIILKHNQNITEWGQNAKL
ncbi:MAG: 4-hydroxy-tetrahydrodipicolinate synthase [Bacteriovoracaceae bacterium]